MRDKDIVDSRLVLPLGSGNDAKVDGIVFPTRAGFRTPGELHYGPRSRWSQGCKLQCFFWNGALMSFFQRLADRSPLGWRPYARQAHSQEGEDIVLARLFGEQDRGFYVDVGAHHPFRFSNTYWAYRRGWTGINIDATPGFDSAFKMWRRRDLNITAFVSEDEGQRDLTTYVETALNTGEVGRIKELEEKHGLVGTRVSVEALKLKSILDRNLPPDTEIDLLTIDVEGSELEVLSSNDWSRFRPRVVVIEVLGRTLGTVGEAESVRFLMDRGYTPVSMLYHSVIAVEDRNLLTAHWG